ncbi:hypothetical protein CHH28_08810 [Bacterioplanes sanyensis]|uniref:HTH araC/xylS-type domain-containing protein n=1 Tax=Bacterioplanes sanyensis TaxID=1249553 RepID=A0A222FJL2_9GAMM|nr:helix-turn-helix domain-containing protein [Bacterioplanes sanyensis]ASP38776.1 hypothetical protein CHH28_08810 [Bacterioplanes sanyensis]
MEPSLQMDALLAQQLLQHASQYSGDLIAPNAVVSWLPEVSSAKWVDSRRFAQLADQLSAYNGLQSMVSAGDGLACGDWPTGKVLAHAPNLAAGLQSAFALAAWLPPSAWLCLGEQHDLSIHISPRASESVQLLAISWLASACCNALGSAQGVTLISPPQWHRWLQPLQPVLRDGEQLQLYISSHAAHTGLSNHCHNSYSTRQRACRREQQKLVQHIEFYQQLKQAIQDQLHIRPVNQAYLARLFNTNVRNLQRRLQTLGTNYQTLLDEARRSLAMTLLADASLPLYEISFRIGYTEPSAFYKAFRRWTGMTPGAYRRRYHSQVKHSTVMPYRIG